MVPSPFLLVAYACIDLILRFGPRKAGGRAHGSEVEREKPDFSFSLFLSASQIPVSYVEWAKKEQQGSRERPNIFQDVSLPPFLLHTFFFWFRSNIGRKLVRRKCLPYRMARPKLLRPNMCLEDPIFLSLSLSHPNSFGPYKNFENADGRERGERGGEEARTPGSTVFSSDSKELGEAKNLNTRTSIKQGF